MRKSDKSTGTRDPDGKNVIKTGGHFTNTAVPRFDGGVASNSTCRFSRLL